MKMNTCLKCIYIEIHRNQVKCSRSESITKLHTRKKERRDLNKEFLSNRIYHKAGCWTLRTMRKENRYPKKNSILSSGSNSEP